MENAQRTSFYPGLSKVGFAFFRLRVGAHDRREKDGLFLGAEAVATMSLIDFLSRFSEEFAPAFEV